MATATATIVAGGSHPNHGGIIPAATLTLWENSVPRWRLDHTDGERPSASWVPTGPETILDDGLLLLAAASIEDPRVLGLLDAAAGEAWRASDVDLGAVLGTPTEELRGAARDAVRVAKLVVTVLEESSIRLQLHRLADLGCDLEVCVPTYWRRSSQWQPEPEIGGELP